MLLVGLFRNDYTPVRSIVRIFTDVLITIHADRLVENIIRPVISVVSQFKIEGRFQEFAALSIEIFIEKVKCRMIFQDMKKNVQNLTGTLRIQYKLTILYPSADAGQEFSGRALQTGDGRPEKATCIFIERLSTSQGLPLRHPDMTKEMIQWLGLQDEPENIRTAKTVIQNSVGRTMGYKHIQVSRNILISNP